MGWLIKAEAALRQLGVLHILDDSPPTRQSVAADNTELNPKNAAQVAGFISTMEGSMEDGDLASTGV